MQSIQEKVAAFIASTSHPHAPNYNTINSVFTNVPIEELIKEFLGIISRQYIFIDYSSDLPDEDFLKRLVGVLSEGVIVFVNIKSTISPVVFDQLSSIREQNKFTVDFVDESLNSTNIHVNSSLFLISDDNLEYAGQVAELSDHILDLRREEQHD